MLLSFCQWVQSTAFFTELRASSYVYPIILSLHMTGIALFGGMLLMTNLRLLGWAMRSRPIAEVVNQLRVPKRYGLLLTVTCGMLMLGSKAEEYYYNVFFWTKMSLLGLIVVHALVFRGMHRHPEELDTAPAPPARARLAGALSFILWIAVACAGRGIGYIEPPLDRIHAHRTPATAVELTARLR